MASDKPETKRTARKPRGGVWNRGTRDKPQWYVRYVDSDGKQKTKHTHQPTKERAEKFLAEIRANVARGIAGHPRVTAEDKERRALTVGDLLAQYLDKYNRPSVHDIGRWRQCVGAAINCRIKPYPIAHKIAMELRPADVVALRDALRDKGYSGSAVNDALKVLSGALMWAMDHDIIPPTRNPTASVERARVTPLEERYSLAEIHKLLRHAPPDLLPLVAFSAYTGCRPGEARGMVWSACHLDAPIPFVEIRRSYEKDPKTRGSRRLVPVHGELLPILREWEQRCPEVAGGVVFPAALRSSGNGAMLGYRLARTDDDFGLPDLLRELGCHVPMERATVPGRKPRERVWHTFRHTLISELTEAGASGDAISRIVGHDGKGSGAAAMTLSYAHVSLEYLSRELAKVSFTPPPEEGIASLPEERRRRAAAAVDHR